MKNKHLVCLVLAAALSLSACGGEDEDTAAAEPTPPVTPTPPPTPTPTNTPPTIMGTPATTVQAGQAYAFTPSASDADNDTLTFSASGLPSWASFNATSGAVTGSPGDANVGTSGDISISASDGKATAALAAFRIQVTARPTTPPPANTPPTISGVPPASVTAGTAYSFQPTAADANGDSLSFSITNRPTWATFSTATGRLSGTPGTAHVLTYSNITIRVSDGQATVALPTFLIQVQAAANRAPTISGSPNTSATAGTAWSFQPSASDADGDTLTFSIQNRPAWATFNTGTGRLSGTPAAANVGSFANILISVSDGRGATAALPGFTLSVAAAANRAPTISGTPGTSVNVGSAYTFTPTADDPDDDTIAFGIANKPAWATFDTTTGRLSGTPAAADVGTTSNIVISVSDGKGGNATLPAFAITVNGVTTGSATLSWTAPTENEDGTTLTNLAGYRIAYGTSASALTQTVQVTNPGLTTYVIDDLAQGTWYFAMRAYTSAGLESAQTNVVSKTIQ